MKPESEIHGILRGLARIDEMLTRSADRLYVVVDSVSHWSPAQQIEHVLLSLQRFLEVIDTLARGTDPRIEPGGSPRMVARALLLAGRIPRGRSKAPDSVLPVAIPSRAELKDRHRHVRSAAEALAPRAPALREAAGTIPHPMLGSFSALQWLRFARIHTDHHLAIIDDIDRRRAVGEPLPDTATPLGEQP